MINDFVSTILTSCIKSNFVLRMEMGPLRNSAVQWLDTTCRRSWQSELLHSLQYQVNDRNYLTSASLEMNALQMNLFQCS